MSELQSGVAPLLTGYLHKLGEALTGSNGHDRKFKVTNGDTVTWRFGFDIIRP